MTKKDYRLIAESIRDARVSLKEKRSKYPNRKPDDVIINFLCLNLKDTNPGFDTQKFIDACRV